MSLADVNPHLWAALAATVAAQILKLALVGITERRFAPERLLETGGMPSSHSAAVSALAISVGLGEGWASTMFAVSAVLAAIVMYDATGIRRAAGMQAQMINDLVSELSHLFDDGFRPQSLQTLLGHTYPQVLVGSILGVITAFVLG